MKKNKPTIGDILGRPGVAKDFLAANPHLMRDIQAKPRAATGPPCPVSGKSAGIPPKAPPRPKKRSTSERMMKAELDRKLRLSEIHSYQEQPLSLTVGTDTCKYTPDFLLRKGAFSKPILIECKGSHKWEDAIVKFKAAKMIWGWLFDFEMWEYTQELGWRQLYVDAPENLG
jgi:hypothetical protein